ncbi:hypothetical protein [Roseibium sp. Sym1]|uniref:hypothetical protein n=1 Tax=Roseibium sp. Sym1 TaxID=3016006 RepID=UPI0022B2D8A8|nr:hypothetical protein [Roseibium sp. Sym1]
MFKTTKTANMTIVTVRVFGRFFNLSFGKAASAATRAAKQRAAERKAFMARHFIDHAEEARKARIYATRIVATYASGCD